ncbi:AAA family ATPase [Nonomuraea roseoviolacea]|uniref:Endopeptidase Clp ATP-binding regulatory subunit ClpX n=1 Tax=Nonomuraea roseoviolacea subsp. carminata TaxID=160689 RepID=A0ABT1JRX5_9ACTN|nr:AAA family ATPase [Nonomuraea roseoviolacea]MCP2344498.1 endopeptidase Clp ATP-binding regulatory subunit ClpX [Nonomuraea roseoviolacea subsp. carminata]
MKYLRPLAVPSLAIAFYLVFSGEWRNLGPWIKTAATWLIGVPWALVLAVSLPLIFVGLAIRMLAGGLRQIAANQPQQVQSLGRSAEQPDERFARLGGLDEVKKELEPVVAWLRKPSGMLGGDVPRAVLIAGPSGCGKTALARAIAGEANASLYTYSGAEFHEILIGMGSSRMRQAFVEARRSAGSKPVVVFIDQIDLIAAERSSGPSVGAGGDAEAHRTMAQLMTAMDDLDANGRVYVIAATSRPRVIDRALFAPTRFALRIDLELPDEEQRADILRLLLKEHDLVAGVDIRAIAAGVAGFTGAELRQLVHWAADAAGARSATRLTLDDFIDAKTRILPRVDLRDPPDIVRHLDSRIEGQRTAKERLAVAVSNHYLRLTMANRFEAPPVAIRKANVMMLGPTGTGKTMLVETIARFLDVPFVIANATVLSSTGYGGMTVEKMLYRLLIASSFNLRRAEYGIVCVDEFDKLALGHGERSRASSGAVQQELLKLVEGSVVDVPKGDSELSGNLDFYQFDTKNVLFVCLGAFNGLAEHVARRLSLPQDALGDRAALMDHILPEDVIEYGFLPELVGRFPVITATLPLDHAELVRILQNEHNGLTHEYAELLALQGRKGTVFTQDGVERIAGEALLRGVGARGLRGVMENALAATMFERAKPGEPALIIDAELVGRGLNSAALVSPSAGGRALTPHQVSRKLAGLLPGAVRAREALAVASSRHYGSPAGGADRRCVVLVDPRTGQRTALVEALAEVWDVPWAVLDASALTGPDAEAAGEAAGQPWWVTELVEELVSRSSGRPATIHRGVILVDALDVLLARHPRRALTSVVRPLVEGRPLPGGFPTDRLMLVLAGSFAPPQEDAGPTDPARVVEKAGAHYPMPAWLRDRAVLAVTDLAHDHEGLLAFIRRHDHEIRRKYQPILDSRGQIIPVRAELHEDLARRAEQEGWRLADVSVHLENALLRDLG